MSVRILFHKVSVLMEFFNDDVSLRVLCMQFYWISLHALFGTLL